MEDVDPESTPLQGVQAAKAARTKLELLRQFDYPIEGPAPRVVQGSREKAEKAAQPLPVIQAEHLAETGAGSLPAKGLTVTEALQSMRDQGEPVEFLAMISRTGFLEKLKAGLLRSSATESQVAEDSALQTTAMDEDLGEALKSSEKWESLKDIEISFLAAQDQSSGPSSYYSKLPQPPQHPSPPRPPTLDLDQYGHPESFHLVHSDAYAADDSAQPGPSSGPPPGTLPDPYPEPNYPGPHRSHASEYSSGPKSRLQKSDAIEDQPLEEYGSGDYLPAPGKSPMLSVRCRFY
jgi:hypothetical protein